MRTWVARGDLLDDRAALEGEDRRDRANAVAAGVAGFLPTFIFTTT
jgi:hypothetical protein